MFKIVKISTSGSEKLCLEPVTKIIFNNFILKFIETLKNGLLSDINHCIGLCFSYFGLNSKHVINLVLRINSTVSVSGYKCSLLINFAV